MGGIGASVDLPATVSGAGGLGMLGGAGMSADPIEQMLDAMSAATTGPFGVDFLMPFVDRDAVIVASKRSPVVEFFYGDPEASLIDLVHEGRCPRGLASGIEERSRRGHSCGLRLHRRARDGSR
jgi:Dioxygenases related to 2-nitropropane dioxygenase